MKKRFVFVILCIMVAISMAACGKEKEILHSESSGDVEIVETAETLETEEIEIPELPVDGDVELPASPVEEDAELPVPPAKEDVKLPETVESYANKYEAFLEGGEPLFFHDYREDNLFGEFIKIDNGHTIDELLQAVVTYYELEKVPDVEYAYMDCGNDGVEELAVRFCGTDRYSEGDDSTMVFVVKEKGDKLEMCFAYETWARSDSTLNYYGYYTSAGSGGASNHGWDVGYINGTGQYIFVQAGEEESDIGQLYWDDELGKVPEIAETKQYEGLINVVTTYMDRVYEDKYGWYSYKDRYYTFFVSGADEKIPDIYAAGVYKEIFDEAGIKVYRPEEIDVLILEKEESLGITEEIRQGKILEWNR